MDKITLQSGVKRIQVNENGDFITFDARDQGFTERFMKLLKDFTNKKAEYDAKVKDLQSMPCDTEKEQLTRATAALEFNSSVCNWMAEQINAVFQDDVKQKVFGDITPTGEAWAEFMYQLAPIVQVAKAEQSERVRKYTAKYTG